MSHLVKQLEETIYPLSLTLSRQILRVFAYIQPQGSLPDGERYELDLATAKFKVFYGEEVAYEASLQVIATYDRGSQLWAWPRTDVSIPGAAYQSLFHKLASATECQSYLTVDRFPIKESLAPHAAAWFADRAGYAGIYPALVEPDRYLFLALETFKGVNGRLPLEVNCCFCFCDKNSCATMMRFDTGLGICDRCARSFVDITRESPGGGTLRDIVARRMSEPRPEDTHPTFPCVTCGCHGARIFGSQATLCFDCVLTAAHALGISDA